MSLLRALGNVIANLAARTEPSAVRAEANAEASPSFKSRLAALECTEVFLQQVRPQVQAVLHNALERSVAHTDVPITSVATLLDRVRTARTGQAVAVGRSGWAESHPESQYANDLAALAVALEELLNERTVPGGDPSASSGSSPSAA